MKLIDVLNHHLKGGKFEYKSFDFKKAKEDHEQSEEWQKEVDGYYNMQYGDLQLTDKYQIPEETREKYSYFRFGKLRKVEFSPSGEIYRLYIGARYAVAFYENDLINLRLI